MKYLKKYGNFSINEATENESILIKNKGMSKDEEKAFLNDIFTYIKGIENISDILNNKVRIKNDDIIVVDRRGKNVLFKYKQDSNEKIKVYIKSDLFEQGKKEDILNLLISKGADVEVSKPEEKYDKKVEVKTEPKTNIQKISWEDFNKKWVSVINLIKTDGVKNGVPLLKIADMNSLYTSKKEYVLFVQEFLNFNNKSNLILDGKFGNNTSLEVRKFQIANNLADDGVVGPLTWEKIMDLSGNPIKGLKIISTSTPIVNNVNKLTSIKVGSYLNSKTVASLFENKIFEAVVSKNDVKVKVLANDGKTIKLQFSNLGKIVEEVFNLDVNGAIIKDIAKMSKVKIALGIERESVTIENRKGIIKDVRGKDMSLETLKNAGNAWYNNPNTVLALIVNNADNSNAIHGINELYFKNTNSNLFQFAFDGKYESSWSDATKSIFTSSILSPVALFAIAGTGFNVAWNMRKNYTTQFNLLDILTTYLQDAETDANVLHWCIDGPGTEDNIIEMLINKRAGKPASYKQRIASEYLSKYNATLGDDLADDDVDSELIGKIVPNYIA